MVFQAAQLIVVAVKTDLLIIHGIKPAGKGQPPLGHALIQRPQVVGVQDVKGGEKLGIGGSVMPQRTERLYMRQVDAFAQPNGTGTHRLHGTAGLPPEFHRNGTGHITAEAIDELRPVAQRFDLILPQRPVFVVQIDDVGPVAHLIAAGAVGPGVKVFRVLRYQRGIGGGVVIHHIDDAFHAPAVDLLHEKQKVLQRAVFRVDGAVVTVGIGAAERALFILHADGMDGHEPDDIHPQRGDAVEIRHHRPEGALRGMAADVKLIDDAAAQPGIGTLCHNGKPPLFPVGIFGLIITHFAGGCNGIFVRPGRARKRGKTTGAAPTWGSVQRASRPRPGGLCRGQAPARRAFRRSRNRRRSRRGRRRRPALRAPRTLHKPAEIMRMPAK